MSQLALPARSRALPIVPALFCAATFSSAALVFLVEPLVGKLTLPLLGGSPAVWNTSLAFFQAALLAGYAYAHLLQRLGSVRIQAFVHLSVLVLAGLTLPLHLTGLFGEPPVGAPIPWLLGVLAVSIGAPFAALSATAPLLQAWYARSRVGENPYGLYAASNLGSLLALLAYPAVVEPGLTLHDQRLLWSLGYGLFALGAAGLAVATARFAGASPAAGSIRVLPQAAPGAWRERLVWLFLAAVPSSLMLGVTSHITTDVASAPFLWVVPLALYLLTFVIAFQSRTVLSAERTRLYQAAALAVCVPVLAFRLGTWPLQLGVHLLTFFLTALLCHQALAARRPQAERLTEFYLMTSLGGVIGGSFNAFLAPLIFNQAWEYPVVLALAGLANPWRVREFGRRDRWLVILGLAAAVATMRLSGVMLPSLIALMVALGAAVALRERALAYVVVLAAALIASESAAGQLSALDTRRSFFGVHRVTTIDDPAYGRIRMLFNGTTLHGAQGEHSCTPMTYYAPATPIGQAFQAVMAQRPSLRIGAVGLGSGAVATYTRAGDSLRFFEIDPAVVQISRDSGRFSYLRGCAHGAVDYVLGDARLTLAKEPDSGFDLLLIDAFSSDSVPTHLMTVEAMRGYLRALSPDGVLLLHVTNRNLRLLQPAAAAVRAAGGFALAQSFQPTRAQGRPPVVTNSTVLAVAHTPEALRMLARDPRWRTADSAGVAAWTDDYTNVLGALVARLRGGPGD